jgi:hypothetical protein
MEEHSRGQYLQESYKASLQKQDIPLEAHEGPTDEDSVDVG